MCFCLRCVTVCWTQSRMQQSVNTCTVKLLLKSGSRINAWGSDVCVLINAGRVSNNCQSTIDAGSPVDAQTVEMGRMSDYDIRPKPKVWAGSPNECRTFGRTSAECCVLG